jgi:hypothetical protein
MLACFLMISLVGLPALQAVQRREHPVVEDVKTPAP